MSKKQEKKITPHNKKSWKKLDEVEKFENKIEGKWIQKGPHLINKSGKLEYAVYVGMDKKLVGVDEQGKPVLESK